MSNYVKEPKDPVEAALMLAVSVARKTYVEFAARHRGESGETDQAVKDEYWQNAWGARTVLVHLNEELRRYRENVQGRD